LSYNWINQPKIWHFGRPRFSLELNISFSAFSSIILESNVLIWVSYFLYFTHSLCRMLLIIKFITTNQSFFLKLLVFITFQVDKTEYFLQRFSVLCIKRSLRSFFVFRVSTKWPYFWRKYFVCDLLHMKRNKFYVICAKPEVNFYAKHVIANLPKLTVSAQNQTTEGLLKNLHRNKLWFCCSQLVTFSYKIFKLRDKNQ